NAQRPCSTCVKSHANARAISGPAAVPPHPECTYDEVPEPRPQAQDPPKSRYQRLESRLNELETLLKEKEMESRSSSRMATTPPLGMTESSLYERAPVTTMQDAFGLLGYNSGLRHSSEERLDVAAYATPRTSHYSPTPDHDALFRMQSSSLTNPGLVHDAYPQLTVASNASTPGSDFMQDMYGQWPSWNPKLPSPEMLHHLVEVFFNSVPHAARILHKDSFMTSLSMSSNDPRFPPRSILHSICAIASIFSPAMDSTTLRTESFGERQAKFAREAQRETVLLGEGNFAGIQSILILSWYYLYHARWVDVWMASEEVLRLLVPVGLNVCEPQTPLVRSWKAYRPFIPPAQTPREEEIRRNTFWLAYAGNRFQAAGNEFAMTLDDEDITQVLPCTYSDIIVGKLISCEQRQRLNHPSVLKTHPEGQTDSFTLYIKAMILLSKVKIFNLRFKRNFQISDPRENASFKGLESHIAGFTATFPQQFKDPLSGGIMDSYLYVAHLIPHTAMILLHDPHADINIRDRSWEKLSAAAGAISNLAYGLCSTDNDFTFLDPAVSWCWYTAGTVFVQEMQQAQKNGQDTRIPTLRSQVQFIRSALGRLGQRLPVGFTHMKQVDDFFVQEVSSSRMSLTGNSTDHFPLNSLEIHQLVGTQPLAFNEIY
ncbi:hypothetical protein M422DRAFT_29742, partial [Sphaerobolus stellatus SS14]